MKISQEKIVIIIAALSQLFMQLVANMATIIIPEIAMELNITSQVQLWINIIYLCSLVAISIPLGKVISQYGIKKSLILTNIFLIVSVLFCGVSVNFYMILLGRLIQGICCASLGISIYIMLVEELDEDTLGSALGLVGSSGYIGLTLAPSLTGFATCFFGWRTAFLLLIPFFIFQLILLYSIKTEWKREKNPFDKKGSLIYIFMMIFFTIGLTELDSVYNIFIIFSFILVIIFSRYEKKQKFPALNIKLFKNFELFIGFYAAMVAYFVTSIAITVLTYHLSYPMNMDLSEIGLILLITPLTMVFISIIAGRLSSKVDPRLISGCALLIILISMIMFTYMEYLPLELIMLACLIQGIGHGFFSSPNNKFVLTATDEDDISDTSSVLSTSKEFGKIFSSGIYTLLFSFFLKDVVLGPPQYDNALIQTDSIMMTITCILTLSAIVLLFYSMHSHQRRETVKYSDLAKRIKRANIKRKERRRNRLLKLQKQQEVIKNIHNKNMELIQERRNKDHEMVERQKEAIRQHRKIKKDKINKFKEKE